MPIKKFALENIDDLDFGIIKNAFNSHVKRVAQDVIDRPGDKKARTVTMTVSLTPALLPDGTCQEVKAEIEVHSTIPKHRSQPYSLALYRNADLGFNVDSPDNVDQGTMFGDNDKDND